MSVAVGPHPFGAGGGARRGFLVAEGVRVVVHLVLGAAFVLTVRLDMGVAVLMVPVALGLVVAGRSLRARAWASAEERLVHDGGDSPLWLSVAFDAVVLVIGVGMVAYALWVGTVFGCFLALLWPSMMAGRAMASLVGVRGAVTRRQRGWRVLEAAVYAAAASGVMAAVERHAPQGGAGDLVALLVVAGFAAGLGVAADLVLRRL